MIGWETDRRVARLANYPTGRQIESRSWKQKKRWLGKINELLSASGTFVVVAASPPMVERLQVSSGL